jgi:hypothetical protein
MAAHFHLWLAANFVGYGSKSGLSSQHRFMSASPPKADIGGMAPARNLAFSPQPVPHYVEEALSPRIGTTGTLADLIDRPLPAVLGLFERLQGGIPNVLLDVMFGHRKLYGLTRTSKRLRCLEVGNRLSRSLTALVVFAIGKNRRCDRSRPSACKLCSRAHALRWRPRAAFANGHTRVWATHIAEGRSWLSASGRQILCRSSSRHAPNMFSAASAP